MAKKKNNNKNKSLTIIVIVMAIICIFIGYIVGTNIFRWIKGDKEDVAKVNTEVNTNEEIIKEDVNNNQDIKEETIEETPDMPVEQTQIDEETNIVTNDSNDEVYKIQVGAFSNKSNAEKFKSELEEKGYSVIIKEASTYKVRVLAKSSREETEKIEEELIKLGYDTFIVK